MTQLVPLAWSDDEIINRSADFSFFTQFKTQSITYILNVATFRVTLRSEFMMHIKSDFRCLLFCSLFLFHLDPSSGVCVISSSPMISILWQIRGRLSFFCEFSLSLSLSLSLSIVQRILSRTDRYSSNSSKSLLYNAKKKKRTFLRIFRTKYRSKIYNNFTIVRSFVRTFEILTQNGFVRKNIETSRNLSPRLRNRLIKYFLAMRPTIR